MNIKQFLADKVKKAYNSEYDFWDLPYELDLHRIKNWPKIPYDDDMEKLDLENFGWVEITNDKLVISCGGDWQDPHTVEIGLVDNKLVVTNSYQDDFNDGISEDEFNMILFGTVDYDEIFNL